LAKIVTRSSAGFFFFSSTSFVKYCEQLDHRLLGVLLRTHALRLVLGITRADRAVGPVEQQLPVRARHAEHPRDHRDRQRRRHSLDEVALALVALGDERVDDLLADLLDVVVHPLQVARREALADQLAVDAVLGRVELDQRRRKLIVLVVGSA
jgi:hypothetical protein